MKDDTAPSVDAHPEPVTPMPGNRRLRLRAVLVIAVSLIAVALGTFAYQAAGLYVRGEALSVIYEAGRARNRGEHLEAIRILDEAAAKWWFKPDVEHLMARGDACATLARGEEALDMFRQTLATIDNRPRWGIGDRNNEVQGNIVRVVANLRIDLVESGVVGPDYTLERVGDALRRYARNCSPTEAPTTIAAVSP